LYIDKFNQIGINIKSTAVIEVNPTTNKVYVTHLDTTYSTSNDTVSVIDGSTNKLSVTIPVGELPLGIAVNPTTNKVYVTNANSDTVSVIDGSTNKLSVTIPVDERPVGIAVNPTTNKVYVTNSVSNTVSVIDGEISQINATIHVDERPVGIAVNPTTNKVYVTNSVSNTVSVIDGSTNKLSATIPVGRNPQGIAVNPTTNIIYIINSDTVSVIDGSTNKLSATIPVGRNPLGIAVNPTTNKVYVTNSGSNTVSVIDGEISQINATIHVGNSPIGIAVNPNTNIIYVTKPLSGSVLLIDDKINKVILPRSIIFNVSPSNSGRINCDGKEIITNESLFDQDISLPFGTKCYAEANDGFQFNNWVEKIGKNSIRTIQASSKDNSPFSSFFEYLGFRTIDKTSILNMVESRSGNFSANFKEIPPPIPSEYLFGLYTIVATTIVGWSIPSIIGWIKSKGNIRKLSRYHNRIAFLYNDGKLDEKDIESLDKLSSNIADSYSKGTINNEHYANLKTEISVLYHQIYYKKLDSLNNLVSFTEKRNLLERIKKDIADSYSKGKIIELHYNMLKEKLSEL
jgi:YVTN family beta-propeller protein